MLVEKELKRLLSRENSTLFQAMRYAVLPEGKRFRPLLLISAGESFNVSTGFLLPFACAVELIHSYSLVHDDLPLMDDDDFRRGKPSCHKAFGDNVALLAGDGLLTLAFEVMARADVPAGFFPRKETAMSEICRLAGATGMIEGQFLDITADPGKLSEEAMRELILKKTGALITAAVKAGALLGGAGPEELKAVSVYGANLGLAFQIRDDLQDSGKGRGQDEVFRPNYASLLGREEAETRIKRHVEEAWAALDRASIVSDGLRFLGLMLLNIEEVMDHDKNS